MEHSIKTCLTFGGQGYEWLDNIKVVVKENNEIKTVFDECVQNLLVFFQYIGPELFEKWYFRGFDILSWINDPAKCPPLNYLDYAPISYPMIFLSQMFSFLSRRVGTEALDYHYAGHSQGLISAILCSSSCNQHELLTKIPLWTIYMASVGLRCQICVGLPKQTSQPWMLSIQGKPVEDFKNLVSKVNFPSCHLEISIINEFDSFIVSGHPSYIAKLKSAMRQNEDILSDINVTDLKISCPFHSQSLKPAIIDIMKDCEYFDIFIHKSNLKKTVFSTVDGTDLRFWSENGTPNLLEHLSYLQCVAPVNWVSVCSSIVKYKIKRLEDIGNSFRSIGNITKRNLNGSGIIFYHVSMASTNKENLQDYSVFSPKLTSCGNISTKFSQEFNLPPIIVGGMTPCTGSITLVAAISNAGYYVEIAGGALHNEQVFEKIIHELVPKIPQASMISVNLLYLNPRLWNFQFPLILRMKSKGFPIQSVCIAGGTPSQEKIDEICLSLESNKINKICFKPAKKSEIEELCEAAMRHPSMTFVFQWTGGRSGGHHSLEDQFMPLLQTYEKMRSVQNSVIIVGGGIGSAEDVFSFLSGEWSLPFGKPNMPIDGVLIGSRIMVSKEAETDLAVKELICQTEGVDDSKWKMSMNYNDLENSNGAGGVITVMSEFGANMHVICNKAARFWVYMDKYYFNLDAKTMEKMLRKNEKEIINLINSLYAKPYFAIAEKDFEIGRMTYYEVSLRLIQLLFDKDRKEWIHSSFYAVLERWFARVLERFYRGDYGRAESIKTEGITNPDKFICFIAEYCSESKSTQIVYEDELYFISLCKTSKKPLNFIPIIDCELKTYIKKDSLWYSEDMRSVPYKDPQRVIILQGPVSVKHSKRCNETVKSILDEIYSGCKKKLNEVHQYEITSNYIPQLISHQTCLLTEFKNTEAFQDELLRNLGTLNLPYWMKAFINKEIFNSSHKYETNYIHFLILGKHSKLQLFPDIDTLSFFTLHENKPDFVFVFDKTENKLKMVVNFFDARNTEMSLDWSFNVVQKRGDKFDSYILSEENAEKKYHKIWNIYKIIWSYSEPIESSTLMWEKDICLNQTHFDNISKITWDADSNNSPDFAFLLCWETIASSLLYSCSSAFGFCDMSKLVHLSNKIEFIGDCEISQCLQVDRNIRCFSRVLSIWDDKGRKIVIVSSIMFENEPAFNIISSFFIPEAYVECTVLQKLQLFKSKEYHYDLCLQDENMLESLQKQPWCLELKSLSNKNVVVEIKELQKFQDKSVEVSGKIIQNNAVVGLIHSKDVHACKKWFDAYAILKFCLDDEQETSIHNNFDGIVNTVPLYYNVSNMQYSLASGDYNFIHYDANFARLANHPGPISHGMHSSLLVANWLVQNYKTKDIIESTIQFTNIAFSHNYLVLHVSEVVDSFLRLHVFITVYQLEAIIARGYYLMRNKKHCYVFPGQGSAFASMGFDLISKCENDYCGYIWKRAERHFICNYGFSISNVMQNNPSKLIINLNQNNGMVRQNFRNIFKGKIVSNSKNTYFPIFNESLDSLVFENDSGVLYLTEFQQPSIFLVEYLAVMFLKKHRKLETNSVFAGHSLGEFCALFSLCFEAKIEDLCDLFFTRGIFAGAAIANISGGPYGMIAVNPKQVSKSFSEKDLEFVSQKIEQTSLGLCQVVNYNVFNQQYVVSGDIISLNMLKVYLESPNAQKPFEEMITQVEKNKLERGKAVVPLAGINIPFHSRILFPEVKFLKSSLQQFFNKIQYNHSKLANKFIPNVVGEPFSLKRSFLENAYNKTKSETIKSYLNEEKNLKNSEEASREILIELLSYQFASPVEWIKTQQTLIQEIKVQGVTEVGPSSVLLSMFQRNFPPESIPHLEFLYINNPGVLIDNPIKQINKTLSPSATVFQKKIVPNKNENENLVKTTITEKNSSSSITNTPKLKIVHSNFHLLALMLCYTLKKSYKNLETKRTLKDLCNGKSALQNEILSELQMEFGKLPSFAEDLQIHVLASHLSHQNSLGPILSKYTRLTWSKLLPADLNLENIKSFLLTKYGITDEDNDLILVSVLHESHNNRFKNNEECFNYVDILVDFYFTSTGQQIPEKIETQLIGSSTQQSQKHNIDEILGDYLDQSFKFVEEYSLEKISSYSFEEREEVSDMERWKSSKSIFDVKLVRKYINPNPWIKQNVMESFKNLNETVLNFFLDFVQESPLITFKELLRFSKLRGFVPENVKETITQIYKITNQWLNGPELLLFFLEHSRLYMNEIMFNTISKILLLILKEKTHSVYFELGVVKKPDGSLRYEEPFGVNSYATDITEGVSKCFGFRAGTVLNQSTQDITEKLHEVIKEVSNNGINLEGKTILISGCGKGSIGEIILQNLLLSGARLIVTTSTPVSETFIRLQNAYQSNCTAKSALLVVPYNACSKSDTENLVNFIAEDSKFGLPDIILPFAASLVTEELTELSENSESSFRIQTINLLRLLGLLVEKTKKIKGKQIYAILPLSPNTGVFGGDGLYAESKVALRALYDKCRSESWNGIMNVIGANIGWTRGTKISHGVDSLASMVEKTCSVRTFDIFEMAFNICCILHPQILKISESGPIEIDYTGNFCNLGYFNAFSNILRTVKLENEISMFLSKLDVNNAETLKNIAHREIPTLPFPQFPSTSDIKPNNLEGLIDLDKVVVCVGFGELGPWGNSSIRWNQEKNGKLNCQNYFSLAVLMKKIKFFNGEIELKNEKKHFCGWIESATGEPIEIHEVEIKLGAEILKNVGIRPVDPLLLNGFDPLKKMSFREIILTKDLPYTHIEPETAKSLKSTYKSNCSVVKNLEGSYSAKLKKGASIWIRHESAMESFVAGMIPTQWFGVLNGLPQDLLKQIDPVHIYALQASIEAFASAGIMNPYELYETLHYKDVGICVGGGIGGQKSLHDIFFTRYTQQDKIPSDTLADSFINTTSAWINMLLISCCGPNKPCVAACATSAVSVDIATETILSGKATFMIAGGSDDISGQIMNEFFEIGATCNSQEESNHGRKSNEQSRPATTTRCGFTESQGAGIQLLCSAAFALEKGLPIYGVISSTHTAFDGIGRSLPAPGKGILSSVCENPLELFQFQETWLSTSWRKLMFNKECNQHEHLDFSTNKKLQSKYGLNFFENMMPYTISSLHKGLAIWGLTIDDITIASFHGTSTKANDINEAEIIQTELNHLNRSSSKPIFTVWQKHLTGHGKAAAAAWMINGCFQMMKDKTVPGNFNGDDFDPLITSNESLILINKSIALNHEVKSCLLHSFGFGQANAQILIVNPVVIFQCINQESYSSYLRKYHERTQKANKRYQQFLLGYESLIEIPTKLPFQSSKSIQSFIFPKCK